MHDMAEKSQRHFFQCENTKYKEFEKCVIQLIKYSEFEKCVIQLIKCSK